jgi:PAS domain S-box-containing protein
LRERQDGAAAPGVADEARREAERAGRADQEHLMLAQEAAGIGTWDWDLVGGAIRWSPEMYRILGLPSGGDDLYSAWVRVLHPDDRAVADAAVRRNRQNPGPFADEFRVVRPNGEVRWILSRGSVHADGSGTPARMLGINMDITDRKRVEGILAEDTRSLEMLNRVGALLSAELDLERLVQAVTDAATEITGARFGAFFYNVVNEQGESYRLYTLSGISRAAFEPFGMPRNTAVFGPTFRGEGIVRADDITLDPRYGKNAPHHGMPPGHPPVRSHLALPVISRSGEVLGGLFFGHEKAGVFTDRAERAASVIAAQAAIAIDNARLFQKLQEQIAERARAEALLRDLNESLEQRVAARTVELQAASRELMREAEERRQTEAALLQAQKLEAIGQLTGGVAHDFNNLLTAVLGNLELALVRATDKRIRRHLETATRAADRGARLIQQLLAYARKQRLETRAVDANALIGGMDDLLQRSLGGLVRVETNLAPDLWRASTDPTQLELVILNLAINARDAMPGGGTLQFETGNAGPGSANQPPELTPGDYVRIAVSDTGAGMPPDVLARALEPFFTTKEVGKGSGLGLPQVYGVAMQSGGTIRLSSTVGAGTTVELWLPRDHNRGPVPHLKQGTPALEAPRRDACLLIVDDEADVRQLAAGFLEGAGYAVTEAASGPDALQLLEGGQAFDLALVDYAMPGMSGSEFVRLARLTAPRLPVLYVTGYADPARAALAGGRFAVTKPYASSDLLQAVAEALKAGIAETANSLRADAP